MKMALELKDLSIQQGQFRLGPLNHSFQAGSLVTIKGPNGSGKTSILKAILGRLRPSAGNIIGRPEKCGCVGIESILMGTWTVAENVRWLEGLAKKHTDASRIVSLQSIWDRRIDHLSLGWQRRVELALMFSLRFEIYLLDEALSPLDFDAREEFLKDIAELKNQGSLFLVTSHRDEDFGRLSDQVVNLR